MFRAVGAIHLELDDSRYAKAILRASKRFRSLYYVPQIIRYDNKLSFRKGNLSLERTYKNHHKAVVCLRKEHGSKIQRIFNTPNAPNWGGFYERLIGVVKPAIDKCRLASADTFKKIETLLREVKRVVNSWLLLIGLDPNPLTPHTCSTDVVRICYFLSATLSRLRTIRFLIIPVFRRT